MTSYEQLYVPFFNRIEEDAKFFSYYNLSAEEALEIAQKRAKNYLNEAVSILKRNCSLDFDLVLDDEVEMISEDLTSDEINLLADLMYEVYISRDIATLKSMVNALTSTDLKMLHSPANERKTFMDMYNTLKYNNEVAMSQYNGRDRKTGKRKVIDYSQYGI
nr:MAG TPA: hypothetical protein [Caudoviricetes sp.]